VADPNADNPNALTTKQLAFVRAYVGVANGCGAEAARIAGYSAKVANTTAAKMMKLPKVKAEIDRLRPKVRPDIADPDEVRATLTAILRDTRANNSDRVKAAALLAKTIPGLQVVADTKTGFQPRDTTADPATWTLEQLKEYEQTYGLAQG
jgi:phage terminase small subunit